MKARKIDEGVFAFHADVDSKYFEGFWSIPKGVTLNSYAIVSEKIALIDLFRVWDTSLNQMNEQYKDAGIKLSDVDYVILNHLEPDHTDFIRDFCEINKKAKILSTAKGASLVEKFCKADKTRLEIVKTGDTLDLGRGHVLDFTEVPNVHWPETMVTFDRASSVLFTCDAFGSYGKTGDRIFDDEFTEAEHEAFESECLRYYANIVASFSTFVKNAIAKFPNLCVNENAIKIIAPSHGIIWRKNPLTIVERYIKYAGYNTGSVCEKEICVIQGSMYGYTKQGVAAVIDGIKEVAPNAKITVFTVPDDDVSDILSVAYKAKSLLLAMPSYEYKMYPPMAYVINLFNRKHFTGKNVMRIGSFGWVGGAKKEYEDLIAPLKWTQIGDYEWQGVPSEEDKKELFERGKEFAKTIM